MLDIPLHYYQLLHRLYRMQEKVLIQANSRLTFPTQDIARLQQQANNNVLTVNFLGLMGVDAPIVMHSENLICQIYQQAVSHRCYELYYLAWRCTHPVLPATTPYNMQSIFAAGWFNQAQWQYGLKQLLAEYPYQVLTHRPCWRRVLAKSCVLSSCKLGHNAMLGEFMVHMEPVIMIVVGPLNLLQLSQWLKQARRQTIDRRVFADHHQPHDTLIVWQCHQQHMPIGSERRLGIDTIYLGF